MNIGILNMNKHLGVVKSLQQITLEQHTFQLISLDETEELTPVDFALVLSKTIQIERAFALADRYRQQQIPTAISCLYASARPNEALRHFTTVVRGKIETIWHQLLNDLENNRLRLIYTERQLNLEALL